MNLIIAGSRDLVIPVSILHEQVVKYASKRKWSLESFVVFNGMAGGIDKCAREWAQQCNYQLREFHADWDTHGKAAGPMRNAEMANAGADGCLVIIRAFAKVTPGSANMFAHAYLAGLEPHLVEV